VFANRTDLSCVAAARFSATGAVVLLAGADDVLASTGDLMISGVGVGTAAVPSRWTSTRIVLRDARTRCLAARSRLTRTRATGAPSGAVAGSTATALTGASMSAIGRPAIAAALTLRKSTNTVSGSGWLVRYATGS